MRARTFALVGVVVAAGGLGAADPAPGFMPYASSAGRFKVLFPGPAKTESTEVKTPTGTATVTLDAATAGGLTYLVSFVDVPDDIAQKPAGPRLDKVRDAQKGADGTVLSDKDLTVGDEKYPGREVLILKPDGAIRNRIVLAGNRLYQVMLRGPKEAVTGADADRFFASFVVTK